MMPHLLRNKGGTFVAFLIVLFVLVVAGTFAYLQKSGKLSEFKVNLFSSVGPDKILKEEQTSTPASEGLSIGITKQEVTQPSETQQNQSQGVFPVIPASSEGKKYEETAIKGDSVTTLARRAVKQYLDENSQTAAGLTREHKIFIEDYIQNQLGDKGLKVGDKTEVSEDLITEAINQAQKLTAGQLENLKNFSELVWTAGF